MFNSMKRQWKRIVSLLAALTLLLSCGTGIVFAASEDIIIGMVMGYQRAYVNGSLTMIDADSEDVVAEKRDDIVTGPVKFVAETLGATVGYDEATGDITVTKDSVSLSYHEGGNVARINGEDVALGTEVVTVDGRAIVPLQSMVEALGYKIFWNKKGTVVIGTQNLNPNNEEEFIADMVTDISGEIYWDYDYARDFVATSELQNSLTFTTVTEEMVAEAIEETVDLTEHPRLVVTKDGINRIKELVAAGDEFMVAAYDTVIAEAEKSVTYETPVYALDNAGLRVEAMHSMGTQVLPYLGFAYQLTGNKKYVTEAWRFFEAFAGFQDWGAPRHFLDVGVGGTYMAIGYDLMYDAFTADQRATIEDAFKRLAIDPGWADMSDAVWWSTSNANWNPICQTGMRLVAYMMYEKDPELYQQIIALALNRQTLYYRAFEPDGQSAEGIGYFNYGFSFTEIGNESDLNMMGTDFGLMDTDGIKNAGWFPYRTSGTVAGISLGDDDLHYEPNTSRMWFPRRYQDVGLAKLVYEDKIESDSYEWRDLLFYDPELYEQAQSGMVSMPQLDNYIRDLELTSFRSGWGTKDKFISIHTAPNNAAHSHLDAGQVDIQANGVTWVMGSLGKESYENPAVFEDTTPAYMDALTEQTVPGRCHIYKVRAESKSAVVINADGVPDIRPDQDEDGAAPTLEKIVSKPQGGFAYADLTSVYHRDAESYKRGIRFSNNRSAFTIQDEIVTAKDTAKVHWSINTPADITISEDGRTALLEENGEKMWVSLRSPANAKFVQRAATYLEGEEFPLTQNSTTDATKLAIDLENVSEVTISVDFIPLDGGIETPDITMPSVTPMSEWTIPDGPLVKEEKPSLSAINVDGTPLADFQSDFYNYTIMTDLPVDSEEMPVIEPVSDMPFEVTTEGNKVTIVVTDPEDATKKGTYVVNVLKQGLPEKATQLTPVSVQASDTPEPQHTADMSIDGNEDEESRWSGEGDCWIMYDLGTEKTITNLQLYAFKYAQRGLVFDVETSTDGQNWTTVYSGQSEVSTEPWQMFQLTESTGRYVRLQGHGSTDGGSWTSIIELRIFGY